MRIEIHTYTVQSNVTNKYLYIYTCICMHNAYIVHTQTDHVIILHANLYINAHYNSIIMMTELCAHIHMYIMHILMPCYYYTCTLAEASTVVTANVSVCTEGSESCFCLNGNSECYCLPGYEAVGSMSLCHGNLLDQVFVHFNNCHDQSMSLIIINFVGVS